MAWSPEHEARIRGMIDMAVKTYIDTTHEAPVVPTNLVDFYRNNVSYNGATYTIKNTWTQ
jgi:hypothetical protein